MDRRSSAKIFESGAKVFYVKYLKKKDKKKAKGLIKPIKKFLKNSNKGKALLLSILTCAKPK